MSNIFNWLHDLKKKQGEKYVEDVVVTRKDFEEYVAGLTYHPIPISSIPPGGKDGMILIQRDGKFVWEYP